MDKPSTRLMWMFPRNIRRIEPWKLVQIAALLDSCEGATTSQSVQDALYSRLADFGIKVKQNPNGIAKPGGMRTYFAQLECLGFFWKDPQTKVYSPTFAGECLMNADNPTNILRCQLLRMQYPSVYGASHGVRCDESLKVKPFQFLMQLFDEERLGKMLSCDDMSVAVVYGRTAKDYEKVVEKILQARTNGVASVIDDPRDISTPRACVDAVTEKRLADVRDIANTAKNYLEAARLIVPVSERKGFFEVNAEPGLAEEIRPWLEEKTVEQFDRDHSAAWQQRYGRYTKIRAVRPGSRQKKDGFASLVRSRFIQAVAESPYGFSEGKFIAEEAAKWGKTPAEIGRLIDTVKSRTRTIERDTVMTAALSGGEESTVLEKAVTEIFKRLGFDKAEHIGQKAKITCSDPEGGYPDIYLAASGMTFCGFGDTKATVKYGFGQGDLIKLKTYYRDRWKEFPGQLPSRYFVYIAGGFGKSMKSIRENLDKAAANYQQPVSALTVSAVLDMADMAAPPTPDEIVRALRTGGIFTSPALIVQAASAPTAAVQP